MKKIFFGVNKTKVGDVIKTKYDKVYLIGNINKLGGVCDDCRDVYYKESVELLGNIKDNPDLFSLLDN